MSFLSENLRNNPVFYVTRDIERAMGLSSDIQGYFIISNSTPFSKQIAEAHENILLIDEGQLLDTYELLNHPSTQQFIHNNSPLLPVGEGQGEVHILVFKNTTTIEKICTEKAWNLLNPSAKLAQNIEEKISQVDWLGDLAKYLPPHKIQIAKEVLFDGTPFILQFNRAHTGLGTMRISSPEQLKEIQDTFPDRPVRITQFIDGPMLTSNNVVTPTNILVGNISYQITGMEPFTDNPFTTIGNDWHLSQQLLTDDLKQEYIQITTDVGNKLRASDWKGLFGIDIVLDTDAQKLYLIEINARQPASTSYESQLQTTSATTFEMHLAALFDIDCSDIQLTEITNGAQIIIRNTLHTAERTQSEIIEKLHSLNLDLNIIPYSNTDPGSDWIRIQTKQSLFTAHNQLNELGEKIKNVLS